MILLLLLSGTLVPKFHFRLTDERKAGEISGKKVAAELVNHKNVLPSLLLSTKSQVGSVVKLHEEVEPLLLRLALKIISKMALSFNITTTYHLLCGGLKFVCLHKTPAAKYERCK